MIRLRRVFGLAMTLGGCFTSIPTALLLNQELNLFRIPWGIFDVDLAGFQLGNLPATIIFGSISSLLVSGGVLLIRRSCRHPA
jgi:hypothetical protein